MRVSFLSVALCLLAAGAPAYEGTMFSPVIAFPNVDKFELVPAPSGQKSGCLWMSGPRLTAQWKRYSFAFTPEGSGTVCLRLGPLGSGDIPFYYDDLRINGVPVDNRSGWIFPPPLGGESKLATDPVTGKPCLKLYQAPWQGSSRNIAVRQGEKVEVTVLGRSGSVLEAYSDQLAPVVANLDEALKLDSAAQGAALVKCLDELGSMSASKLHVAVPALKSASAVDLRAKAREFAAAYRAEVLRTAKDEFPVLYDDPKARTELRAKLLEAARLSADLRTDCLLAFMFGGKR